MYCMGNGEALCKLYVVCAMNLKVSEIFSSIQGEGKYTGYPTTFVRLSGCNLSCAFCDDTSTGKTRRSIESILHLISELGNRHVCITGGEPLLQEAATVLIYDLVERNYIVNVETNGSIYMDFFQSRRSFSLTMDIKTPSSGQEAHNEYRNLFLLTPHDEVKFVVAGMGDMEFAKEVLKAYPTSAHIIFSPMFDASGDCDVDWLVETMQQQKVPNARIGLQLHKIINVR